MIVRQKKEVPASALYCVAGAVGFIMITIVYARAMLVPTVTASCEARYQHGVRFSWAKPSGEALTAVDLQGKLGGRDWGLIENVRMRKLEAAPAPVVLEVDLKTPAPLNSDARDAGIGTGHSGMGFVWSPKALSKASSGCLSYSVWLPADFGFGGGGVLPGIVGEEYTAEPTATQEARASKPFASRLRWRGDGGIDAMPFSQDWDRGLVTRMPQVKLERGRWVKIDQELVLNTPGEANGTLRVWVDGTIGVERHDVQYRGNLAQTMSSVAVDIHYADDKLEWAPATKSTRMRLSPLEIRAK